MLLENRKQGNKAKQNEKKTLKKLKRFGKKMIKDGRHTGKGEERGIQNWRMQ